MAARVLLVLAAAAVLVAAVGRLGEVDDCTTAARQALLVVRGDAVPGGERGAVHRVIAHCRGTEEVAGAAAVMAAGHRTASARRLAAVAVARDPQDFLAWDAVALAYREGDRARARAAVARAQRLNPLGRPIQVP